MHVLADVNWLLALCYGGHEHHEAATKWIDSLSDSDGIVVSRVAQLGLLRLLNNPAVMGDSACDVDAAWKANDRLLSDPRFSFAPEPTGLEGELRRLIRGHQNSPRLWQDAYLAAFAIAGNLHLVTFDQGFRKFRRLNGIVLAG